MGASNENPNLGSVGNGVPAGFGDVHAVYPVGGWHSTAWQGWPVDWATPFLSPITGGPGAILPASTWSGGAQWLSSVVWACVDLNSRALAQMPPQITSTEVIGGQRVQVPVWDRLPAWLTNPHPTGNVYQAWPDFVQALVVTLSIHGEAFIVADALLSNGFPAAFFVAKPGAVEIIEDPDPDGAGYAYRWTSTRKLIQNVLHVRYLTVAGDIHGHGPLEGVTRALEVVRALEDYGAKLAVKGGVPWAVLKSAVNLGAGGAERLQQQWIQAGMRRDGAPAVLSGDIDLDVLTINPRDMAMLDLLIFYAQRICAGFGVPPFMVGVSSPEGLTYANASSLFDFHYRSTLRGLISNVMTALSGWALPRGQNVTLDPSAYIQPDVLSRTQAAQMMAGAGALTVNEWRAREGLPPLAGGDQPLAAAQPDPSTPSAAELEGMLA